MLSSVCCRVDSTVFLHPWLLGRQSESCCEFSAVRSPSLATKLIVFLGLLPQGSCPLVAACWESDEYLDDSIHINEMVQSNWREEIKHVLANKNSPYSSWTVLKLAIFSYSYSLA